MLSMIAGMLFNSPGRPEKRDEKSTYWLSGLVDGIEEHSAKTIHNAKQKD